jgi:hypothetical protein
MVEILKQKAALVRKPSRQKVLLILIAILLTGYLGFCLFLRFWQTRLIFFPSPFIESTPADYNLNYEEVWLSVSTGKIHGWWIPANKADAPTILYLHGNASNNGDNVSQAFELHQLGLSVLLIDYRGYGYSDRSFPNEILVYEDAEEAWEYLTKKRQIEAKNIVVFGHSLGGAVAFELASRHPEMAGIIVDATFTSIKAMIRDGFLDKIAPIDWLLTQKFDSLSKARSLSTPILLIHGTKDRVVPARMSQELFDAISGSKQILFIPQAGHGQTHRLGGKQYWQTIQQFVLQTSP